MQICSGAKTGEVSGYETFRKARSAPVTNLRAFRGLHFVS